MKRATALVESRRFQPPASVLATVQATQHRVAPFTAPHFSCLPKKSKQKKAPRHPGLRFAKTSLVSALLRGSPRRVILDPSRLIWHPCQMPLCTVPPLGLLTGMGRLPRHLCRVVNRAKSCSPDEIRDNGFQLQKSPDCIRATILHPCSRPSVLQGHAADGNQSTHRIACVGWKTPPAAFPPEGTRVDNATRLSTLRMIQQAAPAQPDEALKILAFSSRTIPVRRPSAGAVQRGIWHGCQMSRDGSRMTLSDDPRNSTGGREVERSETRMSGGVSLLPFFAQAKKGSRPAGRNERPATNENATTQPIRRGQLL